MLARGLFLLLCVILRCIHISSIGENMSTLCVYLCSILPLGDRNRNKKHFVCFHCAYLLSQKLYFILPSIFMRVSMRDGPCQALFWSFRSNLTQTRFLSLEGEKKKELPSEQETTVTERRSCSQPSQPLFPCYSVTNESRSKEPWRTK